MTTKYKITKRTLKNDQQKNNESKKKYIVKTSLTLALGDMIVLLLFFFQKLESLKYANFGCKRNRKIKKKNKRGLIYLLTKITIILQLINRQNKTKKRKKKLAN